MRILLAHRTPTILLQLAAREQPLREIDGFAGAVVFGYPRRSRGSASMIQLRWSSSARWPSPRVRSLPEQRPSILNPATVPFRFALIAQQLKNPPPPGPPIGFWSSSSASWSLRSLCWDCRTWVCSAVAQTWDSATWGTSRVFVNPRMRSGCVLGSPRPAEPRLRVYPPLWSEVTDGLPPRALVGSSLSIGDDSRIGMSSAFSSQSARAAVVRPERWVVVRGRQ